MVESKMQKLTSRTHYYIQSRGSHRNDTSKRGEFLLCEIAGALREGERVCGFSVDAIKLGNVGRFIRNSRGSPNIFAQWLLYDHEDKRVPHIMLFAANNILQGLSCDINSHWMIQLSKFQ